MRRTADSLERKDAAMTRASLGWKIALPLMAVLISLSLVATSGATQNSSLTRHLPTGSGGGLVKVIVEPSKLGSAVGMQPIYRFVLSAKKSVDVTMYELVDHTMVRDLIADRSRGVKVRVILDTNREREYNDGAFDALRAGGVNVVWADTSYDATHQKTITVDHDESLILTGNLTSRYYTTTRDFGVFDTNPSDVSAIEVVFTADFTHRAVNPPHGVDLVWSPGSQAQMLAVINGARHTLSIENEEMGDSAITNAIVAAAKRGVRVDITMTVDSRYDTDLNEIVRAGGRVHLYAYDETALYIHAKTTIADASRPTGRIYVGSINFSSASMNYNRELGIVTTSPAIINAVNAAVTRDYSNCGAATQCKSYR
jgi:phosphatidylserine/phosphatidylglycerophosphate/cardiolipin synthase-like enzyme